MSLGDILVFGLAAVMLLFVIVGTIVMNLRDAARRRAARRPK